MSFVSSAYALFLVVVYVLFRYVARTDSWRKNLLCVASLFFYTWGSGWHLGLLLYSGIADFYVAQQIGKQTEKRKKKIYLIISLMNNLGLLFLFKYLDFSLTVINAIVPDFSFPFTQWLLPIGISFYTFQTMSYTLDVYIGKIKPMTCLRDYMVYVTFFPQLVAGPILRAKSFLPQLDQAFRFESDRFFKGIFFICLGVLKKVGIADALGRLWVDPVYGQMGDHSSLDLLFATYAYAFQIYNDFSGYSDIAIGSALCFGYVVPVNFDSPFRCSNPVDFWNRWHISLSHWVRDYLFYPLMMKSPIRGKVYLCLFTTTLAIGIWHGANWTFICFGFYHAILGVFHRALSPQWLRLKQRSPLLYRCFAWWIYWNLLTVGMFFFRCEGFDQILTGMHRFWFEMSLELIHTPSLKMLFVLCMAMVSHWPRSTTWEAFALSYVKFPLLIKVITVWLVFCVATFGAHLDQGRAAFIYFRF